MAMELDSINLSSEQRIACLKTEPPNSPLDEQWLRQFGCFDIPCTELARRLKIAAEECTYFAPQIMGIQRPEFAVAEIFRSREHYIDNWFVRIWSRKLQDQLLKQASHVLFIHRSQEVRERFASRVEASVDCLEMSTWQQADSVISWAATNSAPLVLFAGGPANKYIAPIIATTGSKPKVVLDLGQAAEREWTG